MNNKTPYTFHPDVVLRTPRLPLPGALTAQTIPGFLSDPLFLESLYIASPVVYDECIKLKQGDTNNAKRNEKLLSTLTKYYLRSSSRCTPFGLFSACSVVAWQNNPDPITLADGPIERHIRLDMHYLCLLAQKIADTTGIKELLTYYTNNSAYKIGDEVRYVEYLFVKGSKKYQITAVQQSSYLDKIISAATNGKKINELISLIIDEDINEEDARSFIDDLINAQVLTSELEPKITGAGLLDQIITTLERIVAEQQSTDILSILNNVRYQLKNIADLQSDHVTAYREIIQSLNEIEPVVDESKMFQIDSVKKIATGGVNSTIQGQLQDALSVLNKLSASAQSKNLQSFANNFYNKYGDEEMPLLQVLDTETGIGYLNTTEGHVTPLIDELILPSKEEALQLNWGKVEQLLHKKLLSKPDNNCIEINDADVKELDVNWKDLPESISLMFKIIDNSTNCIQIEAVGGSTAASLLGRFAHADQQISKILSDIAVKEQENKPEAIYAEVIHLPENRIGNVLLRPAFRSYEIPYLAQSSVTIEKQIAVSDLYVSVKNNIVFLRSKRLNKQVIPRLSTAHNYSYDALPVYQFLCDLQAQDIRKTISFGWGSLGQLYTALPRVMYKNTILSLAQWNFTESDIKELVKNEVAAMEDVRHFKQAHQLPQHVVLTDGDNELLVDLENILSVTVWLNTIRKKGDFILKEFLYPVNGVTDQQQDVYSNQLIATLFKAVDMEKPARAYKAVEFDPAIKRSFSLGSEWTYYKLYCGVKTADKILTDAITPLINELLRLELIDQYFFVRFTDPEFHIRLRLHLVDIDTIGEVIRLVNIHLEPFIENNFIWKEQVDIYTRELERYGSNAIDIAERFFYYDSVALLEMLAVTEGDAREDIRWLWAMRAIDELLNCFNLSLNKKFELLSVLRDSFADEYNVDKPLTIQLNDRYREHKQTIEQIMNTEAEAVSEIFPLIEILYKKKEQSLPLAEKIIQLDKNNELAVPLNEFINSLVHMMLNRIIKSSPRLHEMVIYNFACRYYQSAIIKINKMSTNEKA
jgi:thiopeptide-type bacteriocin biosynthesis protein